VGAVLELDRRVSDRLTTRPGAEPHLLGRANALPTWAVASTVLAARGERGRRAATRAVVAAACASLVSTRGLKPVVDRRRPAAARRSTPSFPSGHAATGTAFATAVLLEWPAAGAACALASVAISAGRVRDGQHHVGDVAAGSAVGAAVAVAVHVAAARR
jgi:membrane-associated phospholipid phosphatase